MRKVQGFPFPSHPNSSRPSIKGAILYLAILIDPVEVLRTYYSKKRDIRKDPARWSGFQWLVDDIEYLMGLWPRLPVIRMCDVCAQNEATCVISAGQPRLDWSGIEFTEADPVICYAEDCITNAGEIMGVECVIVPLSIETLMALFRAHWVRNNPAMADTFGVMLSSLHGGPYEHTADDLRRAREYFEACV